jgi:hypothetical protein
MTFETTPLDSSGNFFDSAETDVLSAAIEKPWAFVEFEPRRGQLARCLTAPIEPIQHCSQILQ